MNEPERLDDLASAHLDGISTSDDPAVLARAAEFERARAAMRSASTADEARRDRIIVAAMDAASVIPLRPRRNPAALGAGLVAAAAAVVVAVAFGLKSTSSGTKTASEAASSTAAAAGTTAAPTDAAGVPKQFGSETSAAPTAADGSFASTTAASASTLASPAATAPFVIHSAADLPDIYRKSIALAPSPSTAPPTACPVIGTFIAPITYGTTPAELWVTGTDPNRALVAVAVSNCQRLAEVPLP
jgi:hypothetical protein